MYEIEFRGKIDKQKYDQILNFLENNAKSLGEDNKDVVYYIFPDKLLKLVKNTSRNDAKVSLKMNKIGNGASFEEIEFHLPIEQYDNTALLFSKLGLDCKKMEGPQKRMNYKYKNCEIAIKYSDEWGYHFEIEKMIENEDDQIEAEKEISEVAKELELPIMSDQELKDFISNVESKL